jgi:hypothetical protein
MKRIIKNSFLHLLIISIVLAGCEELTEFELTNETIIITAPIDSLVTNNTTNTFAWEPLKGATKYNFQIVSPKFDSVISFIIDTTLTKNLFTYTLTSGKYQWRVKAMNEGSQTKYFTRTFTIL